MWDLGNRGRQHENPRRGCEADCCRGNERSGNGAGGRWYCHQAVTIIVFGWSKLKEVIYVLCHARENTATENLALFQGQREHNCAAAQSTPFCRVRTTVFAIPNTTAANILTLLQSRDVGESISTLLAQTELRSNRVCEHIRSFFDGHV